MAIDRVKLPTAVRRYLAEAPNMVGAAATTRRSHRAALEALLRVTDSQLRACELRAEHFDLALKDLTEGAGGDEAARRTRLGWVPRSGRSKNGLRSSISALKQFYAFCVIREYHSGHRSPVAHLKGSSWAPKKSIHEMVMEPTGENFERILGVAGERSARERVVCALGLYGGLRESELLALKVGGIDFARGLLRVWRKKQQAWHTVPIQPQLETELRTYFEWLQGAKGDLQPGWFVVGAIPPGRATTSTRFQAAVAEDIDPAKPAANVSRLIAQILKKSGMPDVKGLGAHTLRRMAAIYVKELTGDWRSAKTLLGHKKGETTEVYLQWSDDTERLLRALRPQQDPQGGGTPQELPEGVVSLAARRRVA